MSVLSLIIIFKSLFCSSILVESLYPASLKMDIYLQSLLDNVFKRK